VFPFKTTGMLSVVDPTIKFIQVMEVVSERSKRKNPRAPQIFPRGPACRCWAKYIEGHKNDGDVGRGKARYALYN